jgi:pyruvate dehydrogenase E1 component
MGKEVAPKSFMAEPTPDFSRQNLSPDQENAQNDRPNDGQNDQEIERRSWLESLDAVIALSGSERASQLMTMLQEHALRKGLRLEPQARTPYVNTLGLSEQPPYPGDLALERRIANLVRWNAMAMVVKANREESGIGGHIATFASCATLYEVAQNHFLRGKDHPSGGDHVYFQGHASPGNYARAYLEGRLSESQLHHFRREIAYGDGLSSYPHPWLMPEFWEYPTVSMGLGPLQAIYHARFMRYLENRGLKAPSDSKVWAFVGDGECDEPETLAALTLAVREELDNLIFVVNCNLQRLDGPVRGNGKIIQELETIFRGLGWNAIKVIWGSEWDALFAKDAEQLLRDRLTKLVDGEYQRFYVEGPAYARKYIFDHDPRLQRMIEGYSEDQLRHLRVGGHDPQKVYAAFHAAVRHRGSPTVVLAKTVKGYGLGAAGEGMNITHQQKKLNEEELHAFRDRFKIPVSDSDLAELPFFRPPEGSAELEYLRERRRSLGGFTPKRVATARSSSQNKVEVPPREIYAELLQGSPRPIATTMAIVRLLSQLLHDKTIGNRIVPIVPDEARTFGMDALFRQCGIYASRGQLYTPVDRANILYYRELKTGQLLEEGISEAGSMSSFMAAATSYATHGIAMLPFFFFYSMFGFQRIGDLIWAAGDRRCRGFLVGATAGRTTLAGEGLQHQDGNSHVLALPSPTVRAYDPAFAFEIAVIVREGIERMFGAHEDLMYYLTVTNELYAQPPMPSGVEEGILRGAYLYRKAPELKKNSQTPTVQLFGSGAILNEALKAQTLLAERFGVASDVWSVTSYKSLHQDALDVERWNRLHFHEKPRTPYITQALGDHLGEAAGRAIVVAASDYLKVLPDSISRWIPGQLISLGTDGFGRSDGRAELRRFFEVDAQHIAFSSLYALAHRGAIEAETLERAQQEFKIDADKANPSQA